MLNTLLESRAKWDLSARGPITSVAAHAAVIGAAVFATAQSRTDVPRAPDPTHAVYFAPATPSERPEHNPGPVLTVRRPPLVFVDPRVNVSMPSVDLAFPEVVAGDFRRALRADSASTGGLSPGSGDEGRSFHADQVEKEVSLISGSAPPRYPEVLRTAGVEGKVLARFVVNEDGRVDGQSVTILRSENPLFEEAVRASLSRMRFNAAEIGGKKVRQLVEMPFVFALSR
ncbi:MAG: energy transducer TonB [Gemmatimonadota bacterium]|nr:energy transducer TonB [Gemmatimonadota bacterium]